MYLQEQCTPLYQAAQNGHINVVKVLMDAKAEIDCICKVRSYVYSCNVVIKCIKF